MGVCDNKTSEGLVNGWQCNRWIKKYILNEIMCGILWVNEIQVSIEHIEFFSCSHFCSIIPLWSLYSTLRLIE